MGKEDESLPGPGEPASSRSSGDSGPELLRELEARMQAQRDPLAALAGLLRSGVDRSATFAKQGEVVEGYRLAHVLGVGGMGVTYLGIEADRKVAVKVVEAMSDVARERFTRECKILQSLQHAGIVRYRGHGSFADGCAWLMMDLVPGADLEAVLEDVQLDEPTLPAAAALVQDVSVRGHALLRDPHYQRRILRLLASVADALEVVHTQGVVHRDLKPANILVTDALDPVVIDFGLSRDAFQKVSLTRSGLALGTLAYMAPEQLDGDPGRVDRRADIYALGLVLYRALVGSDLRGETRDLVRAHRRPFVLAPGIARALPVPVQGVLYRCLESNPRRRYATAAALAEDLRAAAANGVVKARRPPLLARHLRRPAGAVTKVVLACGLLATGLWSAWPAQSAQRAEMPAALPHLNVVVPAANVSKLLLSDGTPFDRSSFREHPLGLGRYELRIFTHEGIEHTVPIDFRRNRQWEVPTVAPRYPGGGNRHMLRLHEGPDAALVQITSAGTLDRDIWSIDGERLPEQTIFVWLAPGRHRLGVDARPLLVRGDWQTFREEIEVDLVARSFTDLHLAPRQLRAVPGEVRCTWTTVLSPPPAGLTLELDGVERFLEEHVRLSVFDFGWDSPCALTPAHGERPSTATLRYEPRLTNGPLRSAVVWLRSEWTELGNVDAEFRCRTATGGGAWIQWPHAESCKPGTTANDERCLLPRLELQVPDGFVAFEVRARMSQRQAPDTHTSVRHLAATFCGGHILSDPCCFAFVGSTDLLQSRLPSSSVTWSETRPVRYRAHAAAVEVTSPLPAPVRTEWQPLLQGDAGKPDVPRLGGALSLLGDLNGDRVPEIALADLAFRGCLETHLWVLDGRTGQVLRRHRRDVEANLRAVVLGDGDHDGTDDYLLADADASDARLHAGAAWRVSGKTGEQEKVALHLPPQGPDRHGDVLFGEALAGAGDLDGDGIGDALVAAPHWDADAEDVGCIRFISGSWARRGDDRLTGRVILGVHESDHIVPIAAGRDLDGDRVADFAVWRRGGARNRAFGMLEIHPGREDAFAVRSWMLPTGSLLVAAFGNGPTPGHTRLVCLAGEETLTGDPPRHAPSGRGFLTAIDVPDGAPVWTTRIESSEVHPESLVAIGDRNADGWEDVAFAFNRRDAADSGVVFVSGRDGQLLGFVATPDAPRTTGLAYWPGDPDHLLVATLRPEVGGSLYRCRIPRW